MKQSIEKNGGIISLIQSMCPEKVLLLNPILHPSGGEPKNTHQPPLQLAYLAASLSEAGYEAQVLDLYSSQLWQDRDHLISQANPDIVGISAKTPSYPAAFELVRTCQRLGVRTIIGGPHPTATPESVMKTARPDALFIGEAEKSLTTYINQITDRTNLTPIPGVIQSVNGETLWPSRLRAQPPDINKIPKPARHLLADVYTPYIDSTKLGRVDCESVIASRGCSGSCTFCHVKTREGWQGRDPVLLMNEIKEVLDRSHKNGIYFNDLSWSGHKEWAVAVCREIISRHRQFFWHCETRVDNMDPGLCQLMAQSGCIRVSLGVETLNDAILNSVHKGTDETMIERAVANVHNAGMTPYLQLILGLPGESHDTLAHTVDTLDRWVDQYDVYVAGFGPLWLFPGSALFRQFGDKNHDWLKTVSPDTLFPNIPLYIPEGFSRQEILDKCYELTQRYRQMIAQKSHITYTQITDYQSTQS